MGFNQKLQAYLSQPQEDRDLIEGANLLLQLNRNRIFFQNAINRPHYHKEKLFYELEDYAKRIALIVPDFDAEKSEVLNDDEGKIAKGKRADHDKFPPEIQQLWVDNAELRAKARSYHEKLKAATSNCDRYEYVTLLIEANKKYHKNWEQYDAYVLNNDTQEPKDEVNKIEGSSVIDARRISANRAYLSRNKDKLSTLKDTKEEAKYAKLLDEMQVRYNELESSGNPVSDEQKEELSSLGITL